MVESIVQGAESIVQRANGKEKKGPDSIDDRLPLRFMISAWGPISLWMRSALKTESIDEFWILITGDGSLTLLPL